MGAGRKKERERETNCEEQLVHGDAARCVESVQLYFLTIAALFEMGGNSCLVWKAWGDLRSRLAAVAL